MSTEPASGDVLQEITIAGLSREEIGHYADVSGDDNPIHTDGKLASSLGLADVPVQGMYLMALVNECLAQWEHHQGTRKLHIRFVAPTLANRDIRVGRKVMAVRKAEQVAILRLTLIQDDKMVAMGEAHIRLVAAQ
ncbi:MAG: MaoC family dehydratase [Hoeflea sp.]|uniref:MaoC family dehydratase n=1 Tax=Hoeflea sp. TaxID=1940281 RepID=UPI0032EF2CA5